MANRRQPLKRTAPIKPKAQHRKRARAAEPDIVRWPELELPFVKLRDPRPAPGRGKPAVDHWAPPTVEGEEGMDASFRGGHYARLAVQHMTSHPDRHPVMIDIIGCMVEKGRFWAKYSADGVLLENWDEVAIGFVGVLADILRWADAAGLVRQQAFSYATHIERQIGKAGSPRCYDRSVKRSVAALRDFATGSSRKEVRHV